MTQHYDFTDIQQRVVDVWRGSEGTALIALEPGDTAYAPGTTKYWLQAGAAGGAVLYTVYAGGSMDAKTYGDVHRAHKEAS